MSLIREALRKSEAERQRAQGPGLHAPATLRPVERVVPGWGPWLAAAVGAALLVGTWWVNRPAPPVEIAAPKPALVGAAEAAKSPKPETPEPPRSVVPEPVAQPPPMPRETPTPPPAPVATAPTPPPEPAPAVAEPTPAPVESLPTLASLAASDRAALPPLKVSMFVWSAEPARRFAIVDGQRVGEGALLAGGTVAEIRPDGVVIDLAGRRLLLPRP